MDVIAKLSSQIGSRSEEANIEVARLCVAEPELLPDLAAHLVDTSAQLVGDCAEVLTKVAEQRPALVAPHVEVLYSLLEHKNGRVRWEAAHAVALVAKEVPRFIGDRLEDLGQRATCDKSVIVRDYVLDTIAAYGTTGPRAAAAAMPYLREGLVAWESKHAARVLRGLEKLAAVAPKLIPEILKLAEPFGNHARPTLRKAAKSLLKKVSVG
ncbi:MAG: hypothetical protein A2284_14880 [Deltaproteobacteria bacterium RIFOXYA12_FULL_61_11]|nr:MAG: hypothetical protein A2284_14880 [Deltaproteobacteria bacterium RIFOXYA12_FULL_61_11]